LSQIRRHTHLLSPPHPTPTCLPPHSATHSRCFGGAAAKGVRRGPLQAQPRTAPHPEGAAEAGAALEHATAAGQAGGVGFCSHREK